MPRMSCRQPKHNATTGTFPHTSPTPPASHVVPQSTVRAKSCRRSSLLFNYCRAVKDCSDDATVRAAGRGVWGVGVRVGLMGTWRRHHKRLSPAQRAAGRIFPRQKLP